MAHRAAFMTVSTAARTWIPKGWASRSELICKPRDLHTRWARQRRRQSVDAIGPITFAHQPVGEGRAKDAIKYLSAALADDEQGGGGADELPQP